MFSADLETSLLSLEKLDRASPDLWPDHSKLNDKKVSLDPRNRRSSFTVPGVSQFVPLSTPQDSPANQNNILEGLTPDDLSTIHRKCRSVPQSICSPKFSIHMVLDLGSLPVDVLLTEVKRLHDVAYELGIEERKEMTRGKYLNIFRKRR